MRFFLDTADIVEIKSLLGYGMVDGITTNPSLILKSGRDFKEVIKEICQIVSGPVSAEVTSEDEKDMLRQGRDLARIAKNVVVKVPCTTAGLRTCYALSQEGTGVNVTLCFSSAQALLAAKAGAKFISPFVGRHDDCGFDGMQLIEEIVQIYSNYDNLHTEVLVASIRHPIHVVQSAMIGADVATIPPKILEQLIRHPLTDRGIELFNADWAKTGQKV